MPCFGLHLFVAVIIVEEKGAALYYEYSIFCSGSTYLIVRETLDKIARLQSLSLVSIYSRSIYDHSKNKTKAERSCG